MGRCMSMGRDLLSLPMPPRALLSCCEPELRRSHHETTSNLALSRENGTLQTVALLTPCSVVVYLQPDVPASGTDRPRLLRHTNRACIPTHRHDRTDRAA